jgi:ABC-type multidrug transport system ATPase subunit
MSKRNRQKAKAREARLAREAEGAAFHSGSHPYEEPDDDLYGDTLAHSGAGLGPDGDDDDAGALDRADELDVSDGIDVEDDVDVEDEELDQTDELDDDEEPGSAVQPDEDDEGPYGAADSGYEYDYDPSDYPAVAAMGLGKDYGDVPALYPLDLEVAAGQAVALIGHNGSGKSTFLKMVAGLLEPSSGEVEIAGWEVGTAPARATTSYLPDDPVLYDDLSVREHIEYVSRLHGGDGYDEYAESLLERLGLFDRVDELPSRFSRGLRQKTSIVLGLVRPFSVLLVDEPFVGLDASGRNTMLELLDEVHRDGAAVLVATHEPEFVERVDRCVALRDGRLIFDGKASVGDVLGLVTG